MEDQDWKRKYTTLKLTLELIEQKADQALQGQYTPEKILGVILAVSREAILITEDGAKSAKTGT
ncbi:MAG: hypothetical protein ACRYGG_00860 [Janthinobacterium lividum]